MDKPQEVTVIIDNIEDFIADERAAGEPGQQAAAECGNQPVSVAQNSTDGQQEYEEGTAAVCGSSLPITRSSAVEELQGILSQTEQELPDPDALWRAGLKAEMRPIAQRAGRKLFTLCASINNAHVGLGHIAAIAQQTKTTLIQLHARQAAAAAVQKLHHTSVILDQAIAALITGCAEASGFTREQIVEVQTDMLRARQLAQAAPPSGIVLPGGGH